MKGHEPFYSDIFASVMLDYGLITTNRTRTSVDLDQDQSNKTEPDQSRTLAYQESLETKTITAYSMAGA